MRLPIALAVILATSPAWALALPKPTFGPCPARSRITKPLRAFVAEHAAAPERVQLPAHADRYRYVMVKGLFGNLYPGYMKHNARVLRDRGLDVAFAPISTQASVRDNAKVIAKLVRESDKPIIFVAHSKGVVDTGHALGQLAKEDPALLQAKVKGVVALQGAYGGSPVADTLAASPLGRAFTKGLMRLVRGQPRGIFDLRTSVRHADTAELPMPTAIVPTASLVGHSSAASPMAVGILFLRKLFGLHNDGLVAHRDAVVPGSDVAHLQLDHAGAAFGKKAGVVTLGLVDHVLRRQ